MIYDDLTAELGTPANDTPETLTPPPAPTPSATRYTPTCAGCAEILARIDRLECRLAKSG